ncbi:threonylcarbamoyl-AMP synthase, partial [bacterium]|nr:threonylcarbamoyl-AMP synthase [bacterium]
AFNPKAVAKIFEVKNRPFFDPLIVHIADFEDLKKVALKVDERVKILIKKFWPGPLTLVLPKTKEVPEIVSAGLKTVAIRMPSHPVALKLIKEAQVPIAAPSANLFGHLSPTEAKHVANQLGEKIDLILDGGKCPIGIESTILDLTSSPPALLRAGGLALEEIERVIGKVRIIKKSKKVRSPGELPSHYAPKTPLKILKEKDFKLPKNIKAGFLAFTPPKKKLPFEKIEILSLKGDLSEAAANFFSALHRLDEAGLDIIYAQPLPEIGLGRAMMERLRKAEAKGKLR